MLLAMYEQTSSLGTLAARAHGLLAAGRHPLVAETLIEHVFGISQGEGSPRRRAASEFWRGQLARVLADASVFMQYDDGTWGLTEWGVEDVTLDEMEYVVVDCETTGLDPSSQRVIEIAAIRCRGATVLDSFGTLVDPQRNIPLMIRQLTGITPEMVKGSPFAREAMQEFHEFAGGMMLVGHNVRFDLSFLGAAALRHLDLRLLNPSMCTIRLATRLMPGLKRPNLANLANALGISVRDRHRAMGDALVTQRVFWELVTIARERGIATQGRLQALVGPTAGSARAVASRGTGRLLLDPALRRNLPEYPGVYLMKDECGKVIYIGKAKNLKQRIASYYSQPLGYRRKMDGLLESVRDLQTIVVGSELEALVKESQLIKAYMPQFNVQLRNYRHYPFIKVDVASSFPRVYATREVRDDGARYFGPYRSRRAVATVIDLVHRLFPIRTCTRAISLDGKHKGSPASCLRFYVGRCLGPCHGAVTPDRYRLVVEDVLAFLSGDQDAMLTRVDLEMRESAERLDFERSARLRDALRQARQVLAAQQLLTGAVERNNLVIVCPGTSPEAVELFGIRHGRLFEQFTLVVECEEQTISSISRFLERLQAAVVVPPVVGQDEIDAIIIVGRWLARYGESRRVVRLPATLNSATARDILDVARRVRGEVGVSPEAELDWVDVDA
jgi:DNA polymerase III epsilon subunit family exonuclease